MKFNVVILLILLCFSCKKDSDSLLTVTEVIIFFNENPDYVSDGFDFPVGIPDADKYYNARPYRKFNHLGEDWNAVTGGNTDLGHPFYSISNGIVVDVGHKGPGWGNVIRVIHYNDNLETDYVESLYAHCDTILVQVNQPVLKGEQIGTIGTANGAYMAHLHLEIRDSINQVLGMGYSPRTDGFVKPTDFIEANRSFAE